MATIDGAICPKGQAGLQSAYDPYRVVKVLKRSGPRGSNQWQTITFDQAVTEIVEGGALFKNVAGEENRRVTGLRELHAVRDPRTMKALADDAALVASKKLTLEEFKAKHAANLDKLIDPDHPDLGPKNNQLIFNWGRLKGGRSDIINRFVRDSFGSTNTHGHTTVCQGSLYFTGKAMSEQYTDGKWTGGKKFYWQADTGNSEFIIFVGASPLDGNYGPPLRAPKLMEGLSSGQMKIAVVDPRLSKTAAKAWKWLPGKPGSEGALALGMIRWILDNERYDARFLANANKAAANADKEPSFANGTWLVKLGSDGAPGAFLRASEVGLPTETRQTAAGADYTFDPFVVAKGDDLIALDPYDTKAAVEGDLFVDKTVEGAKGPIAVKSGLRLLAEEARKKTVEEWSKIADLKASDVVEVAREFTSHGKKAVADVHRGVSQHTNGFYNVFAWFSLNLLIGNYDHKGGLSQLATFDQVGTRAGKPFDTTKHPAKISPFGISIIRHDTPYESTSIFSGYPAKRPWYTLASDVYQEVIPSIGDAYPYAAKALILYMGSPVYALPAGDQNIAVLRDVNRLPLFIASDIVIGETTMYADYIFPDLSYLERWEFGGSHPSIVWKVQPVRQPVIAPMTETVRVYGVDQPLSLETMLLGFAEKLGLPGFGKDAMGEGRHLTRAEDFYLPMVANLAFGDDTAGKEIVPDVDDADLKVFLDGRRHLPKTVFDAAYWERLVGTDWWRKVVYVLNRGGRFVNFEDGYDGALLKNKYGTLINLYMEKTAKTINSMTGKPLPGVATYLPNSLDALGRPVEDLPAGFDLNLITHREIMHTKSRTSGNYWLQALLPENAIQMNSVDAKRLGFRDGESARILSATNATGEWDLKNGTKVPMVGKVKVMEGMRPGVISFSLGHGHWAYGSTDVTVDGTVVKGEARRKNGFHGNAAMRVDPVLKNTTLADLVGGSAVFYDTKVRLVKAGPPPAAARA
jgi:anaerobic selenocysteine-containing dehydrogenase